MHELSLAINIIEICEENAKLNNAENILSVTLQIGKLSGVELDAMETAMQSAVLNTMLENAQIKYNISDGKAQCEECSRVFTTDDVFTLCPNCNSFKTKIIAGKEFLVSSLDIE